MTIDREALKAEIETSMLNGEPFSYGGLCSVLSAKYPDTFLDLRGDRLVDRTIQKLRKAGKIAMKPQGGRIIWCATEGGKK